MSDESDLVIPGVESQIRLVLLGFLNKLLLIYDLLRVTLELLDAVTHSLRMSIIGKHGGVVVEPAFRRVRPLQRDETIDQADVGRPVLRPILNHVEVIPCRAVYISYPLSMVTLKRPSHVKASAIGFA